MFPGVQAKNRKSLINRDGTENGREGMGAPSTHGGTQPFAAPGGLPHLPRASASETPSCISSKGGAEMGSSSAFYSISSLKLLSKTGERRDGGGGENEL